MTFNPIVQTKYGTVRGNSDERNTFVWKAIPYAKPPLGELRWKAPRDPDPWQGIREKTNFSDLSPQKPLRSDTIVGSEDCLYLNICRPQSDELDLPVYFWIHGGGNSVQAPTLSETPGSKIAAITNMVFVSINYRLAEFGWFSHPALRNGRPGEEFDDSGNYGTLDIIKALKWVRDNVRAFGGNPENVLVAGESAGAFNIFTLLLSPAAKGLFHKALAQSGRQNTYALADADAAATRYLIRLLVNDGTATDDARAKIYRNSTPADQIAGYLRSKSFYDFYACRPAGKSFAYMAGFEDGAIMPSGGFASFDDGSYPNKVPIIIGMNKEEVKFMLLMANAFRDDRNIYRTVSRLGSNLKKAGGCDDLLRRLRANPDQPHVYGYQFLWGAENPDGKSVIPEPYGHLIGAAHALDIPFFFGLDTSLFVGRKGDVVFTDENRAGRKALSTAMMEYTASFARTGNPNPSGSDLPEWKPWSNDRDESKCILFDADCKTLKIQMTNEELTPEDVRSKIDRLDEPERTIIIEFLKQIKLM